jgi:UTP--glucose-1-phosphate uridylyltransferase
VWCARDLIGDEPFALLLPDMISYGARGCMAGLMDLYNDVGGNVVAVEECAPEETSKYGIVGMGAKTRHGFEVTQMVEKPRVSEAPSTYYLNGRYILQPEIFSILAHQQRGAGNEIQLTDGMLRLSVTQPFHAHPYEGRTFDCGSKQGFIEANVAFALARADIGNLVFESVREMVLSHQQAIQAA